MSLRRIFPVMLMEAKKWQVFSKIKFFKCINLLAFINFTMPMFRFGFVAQGHVKAFRERRLSKTFWEFKLSSPHQRAVLCLLGGISFN